MNIIVSSWPAAGGTTTALILAARLSMRYIYAGGLHKELASIIVHDNRGDRLKEFEKNFGDSWDTIWEKYREHLLKNNDGYLLEGKTAGFLHPNQNGLYKIMIIAQGNKRAERVKTDKRNESAELLAERDSLLEQRWHREFGVNIFDRKQILENYDLLVDNSELSIGETLEVIYNALAHKEEWAAKHFFPTLVSQIKKDEDRFWKFGKQMWIEQLAEQDLYTSNQEIAAYWLTNMSDSVAKLPAEMLLAIKQLADSE